MGFCCMLDVNQSCLQDISYLWYKAWSLDVKYLLLKLPSVRKTNLSIRIYSATLPANIYYVSFLLIFRGHSHHFFQRFLRRMVKKLLFHRQRSLHWRISEASYLVTERYQRLIARWGFLYQRNNKFRCHITDEGSGLSISRNIKIQWQTFFHRTYGPETEKTSMKWILLSKSYGLKFFYSNHSYFLLLFRVDCRGILLQRSRWIRGKSSNGRGHCTKIRAQSMIGWFRY